MTLPASGLLKMLDIAGEFGGSVPHKLSDYYSAAAGVPASGLIKISDFYGKSAATPPTFSFVASSVANANTITIPASAAIGDFGVLFDGAGGTGPASAVTPSGWTNRINTTASNTMRCMVSTKIITTGEPGASIIGMTGPTTSRKIMLVFRPSTTIASVIASTPNAEGTTGDPAVQNLSMNGLAVPIIAIACWRAQAAITSRPVSPAFDGEVSEDNSTIYMKYKIYNASPLNHTVDMADFGTNCLQSMFFRFT